MLAAAALALPGCGVRALRCARAEANPVSVETASAGGRVQRPVRAPAAAGRRDVLGVVGRVGGVGGAVGEGLGAFKYKLEELLTWSLTTQTVLLWLGFFVVVGGGGYMYQRTTGFGAEKAYWRSWCALSGAEPDFSEDPLQAKAIVTVLTVMQFLFFALLVGAVEASMASKLGELKGGRTRVYESNHEVILGWNSRVPLVLRQIAIAGETNKERLRVVVLADEQKEVMDQKIQEMVSRGEFKNVTVICRSGDPSSPADQELVAIDRAQKVVVLSGADGAMDESGSESAMDDSLAFKTALALKHNHGERGMANLRTVVESRRSAGGEGLVAKLGPMVTELKWPDLASRHLVKSALQPTGLVDVHRELLDFDGSELYKRSFPELEGESVAVACERLEGSVLVGIARKGADDVVLNPRPCDIIRPGDSLILLSESKSSFGIANVKRHRQKSEAPPFVTSLASFSRMVVRAPKRRILVLGWRPGMSSVLNEIDGTVGPGSVVTIAARSTTGERLEMLGREKFAGVKNCRVEHVVADPCDQNDVDRAVRKVGDLHSAIVLLDHSSSARRNRQRESRVLESLVSLRLGFARRNVAPKVVCEVNSKETERLARIDNPDVDVISLDEFSGLLLAQAAYQPEMLSTLRTLLSQDGPEIALKAPTDFFRDGEDVLLFSSLLERGRGRRETVLGYIASDSSVVLNPSKSSMISANDIRHIVAVVEDIHAIQAP